ncbi:hypothetical protein DL98DRAFT_522035 [Cadophora sp. DSE1049]|nr:hypothetical protein DL98DRAFT_522035 [Cadophora sp. DSE1049]
MGNFEFSASALRQKNFVLSTVYKNRLSPKKHSRVSLPQNGQLKSSTQSRSSKIPISRDTENAISEKLQGPRDDHGDVLADDFDPVQRGNLIKDISSLEIGCRAFTGHISALVDMEYRRMEPSQSSRKCVDIGSSSRKSTHVEPAAIRVDETLATSEYPSSTNTSRIPATLGQSSTQLSTTIRQNLGSGVAKELARAEATLVSTVLTTASVSQLTLTEIKKTDRHGYIYEAKQTSGRELYEIRVYSFDRKDPNEKQYVKRNCREWKKRRRFIDSHQQDGFVFLILRHPQARTDVPLSPTHSDHSLPSASTSNKSTAQAEPLSALDTSRPLSLHGFTSENMQVSSPHKSPWYWESEWSWVYPVGWSRQLMLNDDGGARKGLFLLDFKGGYFSETVPRRIFSPEHLSHPDEGRLSSHKKPEDEPKRTRNQNPALCRSPDLIRRLIGLWFLPDNLRFDKSLRKHMDSSGFIPLNIVASHNKHALDLEVLRSVCKESNSIIYIEDSSGVGSIKCREGWAEERSQKPGLPAGGYLSVEKLEVTRSE